MYWTGAEKVDTIKNGSTHSENDESKTTDGTTLNRSAFSILLLKEFVIP